MNFSIFKSKNNSLILNWFVGKGYPIFPVLIILMLGLIIRIYKIGTASFWFDEAVTAKLIFSKTIADFIAGVRLHVAASPLDYVITWIIGQFTLDEGILRLPAAIWGTLSLPVAFSLFSKLSNKKTALFAMFLLAVSPLHVRYSQELRFYSSLVFFYLLSTVLLFNAIHTPQYRKWIICTITTIIGIFFHVFAILVVFNGLVWIIFNFNKIESASKKFFLGYLTICSTGFLVNFFLFAGRHSYGNSSLLEFSPLIGTLGTGLGWLPLHPTQSWLPYLWGILCCFFELIGMAYLIIRKSNSKSSVLIYSLFFQLMLIVLMGFLRGYFLAARQFLIFLPFLLFFGSVGFFYLVTALRIKRYINHRFVTALILLSFCLASIPALNNYYQGIESAKGFARERSIYLASQWEQGDNLIFFPSYIYELYKYYLVDVLDRRDIQPFIWSADLDTQLSIINNWKSKIFLAGTPTLDQVDLLMKNGFYRDKFIDVWIRDAQ